MNWVKIPGDNSAYEIVLPESRIWLSYVRPRVEVNYVILQLRNAASEVVGELRAYEPEDMEEDPNWPLLSALYSEAHRRFTGWDKVVTDVHKALAGPGPVGAPAYLR